MRVCIKGKCIREFLSTTTLYITFTAMAAGVFAGTSIPTTGIPTIGIPVEKPSDKAVRIPYGYAYKALRDENIGNDDDTGNVGEISDVNIKNTFTYTEDIPYDEVVQKDSKKAKGSREVISRGRPGRKEIRVEIALINGREVQKLISEKIISEPINTVIAVGAKTIIKSVVTGILRVPVYGSLTSRFGMRWGRRHEGIDIAAPVGTPIYAADGGTVIYAGWDSGYGRFIKIRHDNGIVTCYGHCKKILVNVGDTVKKGQKIGLVGSSGRSTGPHLHFEVRKNGVARNPLKYINW